MVWFHHAAGLLGGPGKGLSLLGREHQTGWLLKPTIPWMVARPTIVAGDTAYTTPGTSPLENGCRPPYEDMHCRGCIPWDLPGAVDVCLRTARPHSVERRTVGTSRSGLTAPPSQVRTTPFSVNWTAMLSPAPTWQQPGGRG